MVMKRYPHGVTGDFFYMKRTPSPRPPWIRTCPIGHRSGNVIDFAVIDDRPSLLWLINLGCIDLNPWYSLCEDPDRPLYIHFDMDPTDNTPFKIVREGRADRRRRVARHGDDALCKDDRQQRRSHLRRDSPGPDAARGLGNCQRDRASNRARPFRRSHGANIASQSARDGRVLVDYNQNAFGKTLASIYSVRANEAATVSTPVTWEELEAGCEPGDFTIFNVPERVARVGDLWKPLLSSRGRFDLAGAAGKKRRGV